MRRFPFPDNFRKRWLDFLPVKWIPAQFCPDRLFFEFGRAPDQGGSRYTEQGGSPVIVQEERGNDEQKAQPHNVGPPKQTEIAFTADDPDKSETDDEEGCEAEEETEGVHSYQCSVFSPPRLCRSGRGEQLDGFFWIYSLTDGVTFQ